MTNVFKTILKGLDSCDLAEFLLVYGMGAASVIVTFMALSHFFPSLPDFWRYGLLIITYIGVFGMFMYKIAGLPPRVREGEKQQPLNNKSES